MARRTPSGRFTLHHASIRQRALRWICDNTLVVRQARRATGMFATVENCLGPPFALSFEFEIRPSTHSGLGSFFPRPNFSIR